MPTLADIFEVHAVECTRSAERTDDPKRRDLLVKLASQWREDAQALRRGDAPSRAPEPAQLNRRLNGDGQASVELYEPQEMQWTMRG
jgi:hypothetical protein